jgi:hypothetical protein
MKAEHQHQEQSSGNNAFGQSALFSPEALKEEQMARYSELYDINTQADSFCNCNTADESAKKSDPSDNSSNNAAMAISFDDSGHGLTRNTMGINETAAGFQIRPTATPLFRWNANVRINGNATDPCSSFEVGPLQVLRHYWFNVYWGSGANRTRRRGSFNSGVPIRDATGAGNTWYHDSLARRFTACGETQAVNIPDSPRSSVIPWTNPIAGRTGNTGYFNYGVAFVAYFSRRDTRVGTGANAFRAIAARYWNVSLDGTFDASQALGSRVNFTGGAVNVGGVINGGSAEYPSMHGGAIANTDHVLTDS